MGDKVCKSGWGGKRREGAAQAQKTFRIDLELLQKLEAVDNKNRFVNEAIREKFSKGDRNNE